MASRKKTNSLEAFFLLADSFINVYINMLRQMRINSTHPPWDMKCGESGVTKYTYIPT